MEGAILGASVSIVVGIVCLIIGILNMHGNISMLHSYHINNIAEEDRIPFGKKVGTGMIIVSLGLILYGGFLILNEVTKDVIYVNIGNIILAIGLIIGLGISLLAIKKYNKKIIG